MELEFGASLERRLFLLKKELERLDAELAAADHPKRLALYFGAVDSTLTTLLSTPDFKAGKVLEELRLDLTEVIAGNPTLNPPKTPGRPSQGARDSKVQGWAAAGVDLLMAAGESETDACKFVAKELSARGFKGRRSSSISPSTVREWRSQSDVGGDKLDAFVERRILNVIFWQRLPNPIDRSTARKAVLRMFKLLEPRKRDSE